MQQEEKPNYNKTRMIGMEVLKMVFEMNKDSKIETENKEEAPKERNLANFSSTFTNQLRLKGNVKIVVESSIAIVYQHESNTLKFIVFLKYQNVSIQAVIQYNERM